MDTDSHFIPIADAESHTDATLIAEGSTSLCYKVKYDGKWYTKKQLKPAYKDIPRYQEILRKEYDLGSQLNSPFIVHYSDFGEDKNGMYLLTDFIDGLTLSDFIKSNPHYFRSRTARKQFIDELLTAVEHLHLHQILHLDLKPANIIITNIGHHVKLIDIGFAYQDSFTQTLGGTEGYSAPEQFSGQFKLGAYCDIYAIGSILREFHLTRKSILSKCMEANPSSRYQSISELREALHSKRRYYYLSFSACLIVAVALGIWKISAPAKISTRYSKYALKIDSTGNLRVKTLLIDTKSQPPLIGCLVQNYDSTNFSDKGFLVGTDSDDLYCTDTTANIINIDLDKTDIFGGSIINHTTSINCTNINREEFCLPLKHLLGNTKYYVKAFLVKRNRECVYGKPLLITSGDYNRFYGLIDVANVFKTSDYDAFDLITDEQMNIPRDGCYYSSNETPKECCRDTEYSHTDFYKFKTPWSHLLWYSHNRSGNISWNSYSTELFLPVMTFRNGKLYITKDPRNKDEDITIIYSVNGNWQRPERFRSRYTGPIKIIRPCLVSCYARRSDGSISYTNYYKVFPKQLK